jgi:hypothetical protein
MGEDKVRELFNLVHRIDVRMEKMETAMECTSKTNEKRLQELEDFKKNEEARPNRILSRIGYTVLGTSITVVLAFLIKGFLNV